MTDRTTKVSLMAEVSGYIAGMQQANRSTKDLDKAGQEAAETARKQREVYDFMGKSLITAGTMAIASAAYATKAAIDWETAWIGVVKVIDGTPAQIAAVEDELRALTRILPASHDEIAAVAEAAGRLGIEAGSIAGFTKVMIDLGEATNITAEAAATDLARFLNVMGDSVDTVSNLGSAIVDLGNNFATSESEIVAMAMRLSGAGRQVGLTSAQVLGLATSLSAVGIEAEAGGSAISKVMIAIASEVANGGDRLETFARTAGMSAQEFSREWQTAPGEALASFVQGLANAEMQGSSALQVLEELGISEVRMRDALLRSAAAADTFSGAMERGSEAYEENNALAVEAAKRYESVESRINMARNAITDAAIDFGQVFLPVVGAAADGVKDFSEAVGEMPAWMQGTIAVVGLLTGAVALGGGAFLLAIPKIAAYRTALATLGPSAQRAALSVGLLGKAGLAIAGAGLLVELRKWSAEMVGVRLNAEDLRRTIEETGDATEVTRRILDGGFFNPDAVTNLRFLAGGLENSMQGLTAGFQDTKNNVEEFDRALADLVSRGDAELAAQALDEFKQSAGEAGVEVSQLDRLFVEYRDAVRMADRYTSQLDTTTAQSVDAFADARAAVSALEDELRRLMDTLNENNSVGQKAISSNASYQRSIEDVNEYIRQAREGVEGYTLSLDQSTPVGSANAAMFAQLAADAQAAALAQFEVDGSVQNYRESLTRARDAMITQIQDFGASREAAEELADAIFKIPSEADVAVLVETQEGQREIEQFLMRNANRKLALQMSVTPPSSVDLGNWRAQVGGPMQFRADGGIEEYANGGVREGVYQGRPGGILKFAEPETGWEAFISGKPGQEARNQSIWVDAGQRLGMLPTQQAPSGPVEVSLAGAQLTLDVDGRAIRAVIRDQVVAVDQEWQQEVRSGRRR